MSLVKQEFGASTALTITLASLANNAGRISTQVDNSTTGTRAKRARVFWKITSGTVAPTVGAPYILYLIRSDAAGTEHIDGGYGAADAAVAAKPNNAAIVDAIPATAATATALSSSVVIDDPGPKFSLLVWNECGQTLDATPANLYVRVMLERDEIV